MLTRFTNSDEAQDSSRGLAKTFPEKRQCGLGWASKSKDLIDEIAKTFGWELQGKLFDLLSPDEQLMISENSAVLTLGALEQTGANYERFLQFPLRASPKVCIHIEPIVEWYDESNIIDYLVILYDRQRNYLRNSLTARRS